jgi:hypothetical protein
VNCCFRCKQFYSSSPPHHTTPQRTATQPPQQKKGLLELRASANRLKRLDASALASLTALTLLEAVAAFSHAESISHEASPVIGALAALSRARGPALAMRLDAGVVDLVRLRRRAWAPG